MPKNSYPITFHRRHSFFYFLHNLRLLLHLIHVDRQFFRSTAYKFFRCNPSASPAHENRNKGSILLCLIILLKNVSAEQVFTSSFTYFQHCSSWDLRSHFSWQIFTLTFSFLIFFQHYNVFTISSVHRLHYSILNKIYKII